MEFSTGLTFTLDHWLLNMAQLIYMIRIGVQIAHLLSDLKGRLAIAITIQKYYVDNWCANHGLYHTFL